MHPPEERHTTALGTEWMNAITNINNKVKSELTCEVLPLVFFNSLLIISIFVRWSTIIFFSDVRIAAHFSTSADPVRLLITEKLTAIDLVSQDYKHCMTGLHFDM